MKMFSLPFKVDKTVYFAAVSNMHDYVVSFILLIEFSIVYSLFFHKPIRTDLRPIFGS